MISNLRNTAYQSALFLIAFTGAAQAGLAVYDPCGQDETIFLKPQTPYEFLQDKLKGDTEFCVINQQGIDYYIIESPSGKEIFHTIPNDNNSICKPADTKLKCPEPNLLS